MIKQPGRVAKAIWITRAEPGAEATANRVRALGWEAVVAPVLAVRPLGGEIDLEGAGALAFTSANAVRAFAGRSAERRLRVFAVGAATAAAAKAERFGTVLSTEGDVRALAAGIATRRRQLQGWVLHPGAAEPAGDLVAALAAHGIAARAQTLYETVDADVPETILARLADLDAVLVHSPKAGRRLADLLRGKRLPKLAALCLSAQVAATLEGLALGPLTTAALPSEDALLSLIN